MHADTLFLIHAPQRMRRRMFGSSCVMSLLFPPDLPQPCHFPTTLSSPLAPTSPPSASSTSAVLSRRQSPSAPARWREFAQLANSLPPTQTGQFLNIEPDMKHAPLIVSESGCNTNTKTVSTPRQKLQDKLVLDGRRSPILKRMTQQDADPLV